MEDVNKTAVGERINYIRTYILGENYRKIVSQKTFGKLVGSRVSQGLVQNWEKGNNLPNTERLIKIAKLGGVTVDWLLFGDDFDNLQNSLLSETARVVREYNFKKIAKDLQSGIETKFEDYIVFDELLANIIKNRFFNLENPSEEVLNHVSKLLRLFVSYENIYGSERKDIKERKLEEIFRTYQNYYIKQISQRLKGDEELQDYGKCDKFDSNNKI